MNQTNHSNSVPPLKGEAPPKPKGEGGRGMWALLTGVLLAALSAFYFLDPASSRGFWICPFHRLTGWYCPGCGGQRALHELLHGYFTAAMKLNVFTVFVFLPAALYAYAVYALRILGIARLPGIKIRNGHFIALFIALILFGILRNIWGPLP